MSVNVHVIYNCCYCIGQQQLVTDIDNDTAGLLSKLRCYKEDLKTANECENCVIIMSSCFRYNIECFHYSIENERESYFRYDGSSTQEGH